MEMVSAIDVKMYNLLLKENDALDNRFKIKER